MLCDIASLQACVSTFSLSLQVAMGDGDYLSAFHQVILPIAREYNPQLVLVSSGFDSGRGDPLVSSAFPLSLSLCCFVLLAGAEIYKNTLSYMGGQRCKVLYTSISEHYTRRNIPHRYLLFKC